jgi:hypothetical protein
MVVGVAHGSRRLRCLEPDPFNAREGGGGDTWWVGYDGLICVGLSKPLKVVVKRLGGEGTSSELW